MRDIRIFNFEFELLYIMTDVISSEWRILYNGVGTFEGHFRLKDGILKEIMENRYIVVCQGDLQAICVGKVCSDELVVCGRTVNWILTRRIRPPFSTNRLYNGEFKDPEKILYDCLVWGFCDPPFINPDGSVDESRTDPKRRVDNFVLPELVGSPTFDRHYWRTGANDLEKICADLCRRMNRGHKMVFDTKRKEWRFEFIFPAENNSVLISKESKTAYDQSYTEDYLSLASGGWYPKYSPDEGSDETWCYYTADAEKSGIYLWDSSSDGLGESEAQRDILNKTLMRKIDAKVRGAEFGKDYDIGDIVTAYVSFGSFEKMARYIVSGINIKYSPAENYTEPVLEEYGENV